MGHERGKSTRAAAFPRVDFRPRLWTGHSSLVKTCQGKVFRAWISCQDPSRLETGWEYSTPDFLEGTQWETVPQALLGQT